MREPVVSIICDTFNHENYIRQCIDGFLMQKTDFAFEVLIHDDASSDGTADIIREYEAKYPEIIKPIYQTINQYSQKINIWEKFQFPRANGKYIALCEGDDYWIDPLKLQKQVFFLEEHPNYSMCFHNAIKLYENIKNDIEVFNSYKGDYDLTIHDAIHKWIVPTASIVALKEVITYYPKWLKQIYSGDYSTILSCIYAGKVRCLNQIMSVYRINFTGTSMTATMLKKGIFMLEQKILLLDSFNKGTKGLYTDEVESKIKYLERELKFQKAKSGKNIFKLLTMLDMVFIKLLKRIRFYKKN